MADKEKDAKAAKDLPEANLRDLDVLDSKIKNVKGGGKRTIPRKRTEP
jgi:hypothetical protein